MVHMCLVGAVDTKKHICRPNATYRTHVPCSCVDKQKAQLMSAFVSNCHYSRYYTLRCFFLALLHLLRTIQTQAL